MSNLLVQNIKHTNGTVAQTIDSTGRITTPARPVFKASILTQTGRSTHTSIEVSPYDTVQTNVGSHFNTSTHTFTVPVAGEYFFSISQNKYGKLIVYLYKNGSVFHAGEFLHDSGTNWEHCTISTVVTCAVDDTIQARHKLVDNGGTQYAWNGGSPTWDSFSGFLMG
jgi:hypothetical protein